MTGDDKFAQFLGTTFVPACALLQPPIGLRAYLPAMVPPAGKPTAVPDQTALMFWANPAAHDEAKKALAERVYTNLHGDVYDMSRSSGKDQEVPKPFDPAISALQPEQPYYLLKQSADWMLGHVHHLVGARKPDLATSDFLIAAAAWAKSFQEQPAKGADGALLCCGNDYLAAWVHGPTEGLSLRPVLDGLAGLTLPILRDDALPRNISAGLWDDWAGITDLAQHTCLNIQLQRTAVAQPRKRGK